MDTTTINSQNENNGKKKNIAGTAATVAAGAAAGIAGTAFAQTLGEDVVEEPVEVSDENQEDVQNVQEVQEAQGVNTQAPQSTQASGTQGSVTSTTSQTETPQPISSETGSNDTGTEAPQEVLNPENASTPASEEPINPEEIAEAIISEEQIDPNDIDMAEVVNFDEIGTVYTVDGESYTAATFHDAAGNQLVMVDVDGDNTFDVVTDMDGNVLANANNMTVDDAEIGIADENTYLASNELDSTGDVSDDSIADDLLA